VDFDQNGCRLIKIATYEIFSIIRKFQQFKFWPSGSKQFLYGTSVKYKYPFQNVRFLPIFTNLT